MLFCGPQVNSTRAVKYWGHQPVHFTILHTIEIKLKPFLIFCFSVSVLLINHYEFITNTHVTAKHNSQDFYKVLAPRSSLARD